MKKNTIEVNFVDGININGQIYTAHQIYEHIIEIVDNWVGSVSRNPRTSNYIDSEEISEIHSQLATYFGQDSKGQED